MDGRIDGRTHGLTRAGRQGNADPDRVWWWWPHSHVA